MTRYRHKLMRLRSGLKAQVNAVMGKNGVLPIAATCSASVARPGSTPSSCPWPTRCASSPLRDLIELYGREIEILDRRRCAGCRGGHQPQPRR